MILYYFISFVRMIGVYKRHLHKSSLNPIKLSPQNVKTIILIVYKCIEYFLFRFYSTEEMMVNADGAMRAARNERSEQEH